MGYVVLIVLIFVAFGAGFLFGRRKMLRDFETKADEDTSARIAEILRKNKELMDKIRNEVD